MKSSTIKVFSLTFVVIGLLGALVVPYLLVANSASHSDLANYSPPPDTLKDLKYPFKDRGENETDPPATNGLYMKDPSNFKQDVVYNPETNQYEVVGKVGSIAYRPAEYYGFKEYQQYDANRSLRNYWREKAKTSKSGKGDGIIPAIYIGGKAFDKIFGGSTIDIRPSGSAELIFGVLGNTRDDPSLNVNQRSTINFDFQEKIQMNVVAKIGDKIEFKANYNTESSFDFDNKLQLKYEGKEDEIIKLIEVGNVTLPLNSTLIQGSQSLFGVKTKMQFGRTTVTAVFSQQESESKNITVEGGAQTNTFRISADQYEENKHFFIGQYFREQYNTALSELPLILSNVNITKMEVWVSNIGAPVTDNRNIVAFQDLGEREPYNKQIFINGGKPPYTDDDINTLFSYIDKNSIRDRTAVSDYLKNKGFTAGIDFVNIESARKLNPSEFTYNSKLGFISINSTLNSDQVLAVAFQYSIVGDTTVYQVGEFSDGGISAPQCLAVKLLKSTTLNTRVPIWNLMMKNVYALGAYQVNKLDFILNVLFSGNSNGVPTGYLTEGKINGIPLIRVLGLDSLDPQLNEPPDGIFDFIDNANTQGGTINSNNGRIFFPVLEPFGKDLRAAINDDQIADKYCYDSLYTLTKVGAQQYPEKNKFVLDGFYKSSVGSEISLNALNVPQGSVKVTQGGVQLTENQDFTVDYTLGRVKIINESLISSGTPINVSLESNSMFSIQSKRYAGVHVDYQANRNLVLGSTYINLSERPLTQKTILGDDPISNTLWGFNMAYQEESLLITKLIDKLPFIETNAPSKVAFTGEFAQFIPGHSSAIGETGTSYVDDFEAAKSTIDLKQPSNWLMASTPQGQTSRDMFPEGGLSTGLAYGYNRAKMSWYIIDPLFYDRTGNLRPKNVDKEELSRNQVRQVLENEVFPAKEIPNGVPTNIPVLNIDFYPSERGPYNYDLTPNPAFSKGLGADGKLLEPATRWGGMMRKIESTDFEATNVEYIEFWMMDPFADAPDHKGGEMYFNLGDISEDILRDGKKSFENGLPTSELVTDVDTTIWGRVPNLQSLVNAFDNEPASRPYQDVGYDGLRNADEQTFFDANYLQQIISLYGAGSQAYIDAANDPSGDDFHYFRGTDYDNDDQYVSVNLRYKKYQGPDGNSATAEQNNETYQTLATTLPNVEDINYDNTLWEDETYFQYKIDLRPSKMNIGQNYIADIYTANSIPLENGELGTVKWYQFKIPIADPQKIVGNISDFKSIRFMRMFYKGFEEPIVTRFATFELVRGDWRRYKYDLLSAGEYIPNDEQSNTKFEISTVNVEENGSKYPVPYVIPPGIEREINYGTTNYTRLNEQAMVLRVKNLEDGDARAGYKTTGFDFRRYKYMKMFVHAEDLDPANKNNYGDLTVFVRLGSDFTQNYYEYEIPLTFTPWGTSSTDDYGIWPEANNFNVDLENLVSIKEQRNIDLRDGKLISTATPYVGYDGKNRISIVGTPSLSDVKAIMIGVRNPKRTALNSTDDGRAKSAELWVNELRLTDFDDKSAWAATGRLTATLADLGNVAFSMSHSTPGFGSIEKKVGERQKEAITSFDFATNLQLGKFFPEKTGIRIPMHFDYSQTVENPEYNPLDPDVKLADELDTYKLQSQKDSIKHLTQDFTQRKNINFMNVRKDRVGATTTPKPWDIENFDFTYAYSETKMRNIDLEYDNKYAYRGGIGYNFMVQPKYYKPLSSIAFISKSKALQLVNDFNISLLPKMFSFRMDLNRDYNERKLRNKSKALVIIEPSYIKSFVWTRMYDYKHDLTQGLKFEYNSNASAYIDEMPGSIDQDDQYGTVSEKRKRVNDQILGFGTMNRFTQNFKLNYTIPINKIPIFNWINATAAYQGNYTWTASPKSIQAVMGNTIENQRQIQLNGNVKISSLYNKVPFLKKVLAAGPKKQRGGPGGPGGKDPKKPGMKPETVVKKPADSLKTKPKVNYFKIAGETVIRLVFSLKDASLTYTQTEGTLLPGFNPSPGLLGNSASLNAPGFGFITGSQADIRFSAAQNGWLTEDSMFNSAYATKFTNNLTVRATVEPLPDLRIEITGNRTYSEDHSEFFKVTNRVLSPPYTPVDRGSFSISTLTIGTSFSNTMDADNNSEPYNNMKAYRKDVAFRLASINPSWDGTVVDSTGFPTGYSPTSQEVLHYSFLAAYTGGKASTVKLNAFPKIPLPNWRLTYKGLSNLELVKKYFRDVTVSHAYRSTYNVGNFTTNVLYNDVGGFPSTYDGANNFISKLQISQIAITEQFAPLFGLDLTWKNNILSKFEIKKSRNLSLSFTGNQLTEIITDDIVLGVGYRFKDVEIGFLSAGGGAAKKYKSDLNLKADVSIKTNRTVLRRIEEGINQISAGQKVITINTSADYQMNEKVTLRLFFDKILTNPFVSNQYASSTTNGGISLRFTLSQ